MFTMINVFCIGMLLCVKAAGFALLLSLYIEAQCHYLSTLNSLFFKYFYLSHREETFFFLCYKLNDFKPQFSLLI